MRLDWSKVKRLTLPEWGLIVETCVTLPLISTGLAVLGWRRLKTILHRPPKTETSLGPFHWQAARITNAVGHLLPIRATCLQRSVTLWWTLGRRRLTSQVVIGVRKDHSDFHAHAWVEVDGAVINDQPDLRRVFAVFDDV